MKSITKSLLSLAAVAMIGITQAGTIITPIGGTSSVGNLSGGRTITKTIDGSGLSGVGDLLTQTHSVIGDPTNDLYWIGAGTSDIQLDFDLDGSFTVDRMHLWNYVPTNGTTNRGLGSVDILFSTDGGENYGSQVTVSFAQAVIATPGPAETQTFSAVSGVTHIRLIADNSGSTTHTAFMEIRFGEGDPTAPAAPFAITEIDHDPDADTVTLTWRNTGAASYIAKYSLDMTAVGEPPTAWGADMGDGLTAELDDEKPEDADHITVTFDLAAFAIENETDLFFRIEEE